MEVLEGLCDVERDKDALSAIRISRDNPGDEGREGTELNEFGHKAVVLVSDKRTIELDCIFRINLFKDIGLLVETLDRVFFYSLELYIKKIMLRF